MKIRIKKHTHIRRRNIFGKPVEVETYYTLTKNILGFIPIGEYQFHCCRSTMLQDLQRMKPYLEPVYFSVNKNGTHFNTLEDAIFIRRRIYSYPDIFINY
jgi:hypothetical protein